jgi:dTDP-4-amino-4,6-dideoxygalactose transaminase
LIPLSRPELGEPEARAVRRPLLSGWVTQGPEVAAFEREFARAVGAKHAAAVSSATTALHLALLAVGVKPGDEVITASHSFIATANAVRYCGAVPVFADVTLSTFNLDPGSVESLITDNTRAILAVHQLGLPCDLRALLKLARRTGLALVEDAACAIGSELLWNGRWQRVGRPHGDVACFSFHPRKVITTGDGGMLTTSNPDFDRRFRLWRQHGMSVSDAVRHRSRSVVIESYEALGYNYRMTDIQAAVGREQLKRLPGLVAKRRALARRYDRLLARVPGVVRPKEPSWARGNWQSYCVLLPQGVGKTAVLQRLKDRGVCAHRGVICSHQEPAYRKEPWSCPPGGLPASEEASRRGLILPLFPQMTAAQQERVVRSLDEACRQA